MSPTTWAGVTHLGAACSSPVKAPSPFATSSPWEMAGLESQAERSNKSLSTLFFLSSRSRRPGFPMQLVACPHLS